MAPDARHPFGTGNCCVFFRNGTYLEPLTALDRNATDRAAAEGLFFVRRFKRFTERQGEGFAMLALRSDDAELDHAAFEMANISAGEAFRFTRNATLPDGSEGEIGVILAYAADERAPDATLFACQRIGMEKLWDPVYTTHTNGALGVAAVVAVAENPADFHELLAGATGQPALRSTGSGLESLADGTGIAVLTPDDFRATYGVEPPEPRRGLIFAAFDIVVSDLEIALGHAGSSARRSDDRIIIPAAPGLGAVLAFRTHENG